MQGAYAQQIHDGRGKFELATMLCDDQTAFSEKRRRTEERQHAIIVCRMIVGRIEKAYLERLDRAGIFLREELEPMEGVNRQDARSSFYFEGLEILFDQSCGGCVFFDEHSFMRATAERFDSDGTGSRKSIDEPRADHEIAQDVKQGFP